LEKIGFNITLKIPNHIVGIVLAGVILLMWVAMLAFNLQVNLQKDHNFALYIIMFLLQTHLYTGVFITAHDAIHGHVYSKNTRLNRAVGTVAALMFAFNFYPKLEKKHHQHHKYVGTEHDPDYHTAGFWAWYLKFLKEYISVWQIAAMALSFNILQFWFPMPNLVFFWMLPAIVSTFQLFYFGTYQPHKGQHNPNNIHKARSQKLNHVWAFMCCYFFGYHYEHHQSPHLPWWLLASERAKTYKLGL
jgi:beta-carotene/zeaxanthin 4-ketolase